MISGLTAYDEAAVSEIITNLAGTDELFSSISARDKDPKTGFLTAPITIARTGIQTYKARELGLDSHPKLRMDPNKTLRLYRPAEEVFAEDSVKAWENCPIIIDHVKGGVHARNWSTLAVGESRNTKRVTANDTIGGVGIIKAQKGIDAVDAGKRYLSGGYDFDLDLTPGQTPSGEAYDGVQRNIRPNHIALVDNPRGGPACRVHDATPGDKTMKKITIDGVPVEVADGAESATVEKLLAERDELKGKQVGSIKVGDASFTADNVVPIQAAFDAVVKERDELRTKAVSDADVEKRVQARVKAMDSAKKLMPAIACDGKSVIDIQREVIKTVAKDGTPKTTVDAVLGATALDAATEAQVQTAFDVLVATAGTTRTAAADSAAAFGRAATSTTTVAAADAGTGEVIKMGGREEMLKQQNSHLKPSDKK